MADRGLGCRLTPLSRRLLSDPGHLPPIFPLVPTRHGICSPQSVVSEVPGDRPAKPVSETALSKEESMMRLVLVIAGLGTAAALSAAQAYEVTPVAGGGEIVGKVAFKGTAPEPRKMVIAKDPSVCGTGTREILEVAVKDGALQNVVIYVAKVEKGKAWGNQIKPALNQQGCRFVPEMLLVKKDEELTIRNSDAVLHNIHTYEIIGNVRRTMFNVGQPDKGDIKQSIKLRRANVVKIECDAHDFMHGWAFAIENPYADVSKVDGSFKIDALPPGDYEVKAWHPVLGEKSTKVSVKAGAPTAVAFEFSK